MSKQAATMKSTRVSCVKGFIYVSTDLPCTFSYHPQSVFLLIYSGADKSLARPGRKQATATEDFDFVYILFIIIIEGILKKVNQSRYRPGVAQRVPGSEGTQIS